MSTCETCFAEYGHTLVCGVKKDNREMARMNDAFLEYLIEREFEYLAQAIYIPALCGPFGRVMPS